MKYKAIILKVLGIMLWVTITSGILLLLISAVQKEHTLKCKAVEIAFTDNKPFRMLEEEEIAGTLWPSSSVDFPVGKLISSINLFALEKQLKKNPWVLKANMYFDQQNILHIDVIQRTPIARIFSPEGNSFYMDDSLSILPLKSSGVLDLPVFTNFNFSSSVANTADSMIMRRIIGFSKVLSKDSFWMAQVEQVNINSDGAFEMITQVGDQRVMLGTGNNWEDMLYKLKKLYEHFGQEHEWNKYESIDLQFRDQAVCVKRGVSFVVKDSLSIDTTNIRLISDTSINQHEQNTNHKYELRKK